MDKCLRYYFSELQIQKGKEKKVMGNHLKTITVRVNFDQLQYQVNELRHTEESVKAKLMRIEIARKYLKLIENDILNGRG